MSAEPEFNAHVVCFICGTNRPVKETIDIDGFRICRKEDCQKEYYRQTIPGQEA